MNNLEDLLNQAFILTNSQAPKTKKKTKTISLDGITPNALQAFMVNNAIPADAWFTILDNGWADVGLAWEMDVPTTEEDKTAFVKERFQYVAWSLVYKTLTEKGYKRQGFNTSLLKSFASVYEMYTNKEFDRLAEYYSLYFAKPWANPFAATKKKSKNVTKPRESRAKMPKIAGFNQK